ncbi:unnamed protein product [Closterium sp. NIES-54]
MPHSPSHSVPHRPFHCMPHGSPTHHQLRAIQCHHRKHPLHHCCPFPPRVLGAEFEPLSHGIPASRPLPPHQTPAAVRP